MKRIIKTSKTSFVPALASHMTVWPLTMQISRHGQKATLHDLSVKGLSDLVCADWHCSLNPEFNRLAFNLVAGQRQSLHYWVKKFGMLGHENCLVVQLPKTQVLLYRPVCTTNGDDYICFHYLNRIPSLVRLEG